MKPYVLGIIPARSGSKRLPGKNIKDLFGKPLIAYTIEVAAASCALNDFIVSTDSKKITTVAQQFGAKVPFLRPASLATDEAKTADVLIHAVKEYEHLSNVTVDVVVTLQPTQPFRMASDIDKAIKLLCANSQAESVITCYETHNVHPYLMYIPKDGYMKPLMSDAVNSMRHQQMPNVYIRNGAVYVTRRRLLLEAKKVIEENPLGCIMPRERSFNIDDLFDFELCEAFLRYKANL